MAAVTAPTYAAQAAALAKRVNVVDVVMVECSCSGPYHGGNMPEDHEQLRQAAERYFYHKLVATMYWGVHWRGRHVLHIHSKLPSNCPVCARRARRGPR